MRLPLEWGNGGGAKTLRRRPWREVVGLEYNASLAVVNCVACKLDVSEIQVWAASEKDSILESN